MKRVLRMRLSDIFRATLEEHCGNVGYIGIAPDGSDYHVAAPVDRQIARGLRFWNPPEDGTPFGGYKGWRYFRCRTYTDDSQDLKTTRSVRLAAVRENMKLIQKWAAQFGIEVEPVEDMDAD